MSLRGLVAEQRFVLDITAELGELAEREPFVAATPDVLAAILRGAAQLSEEAFAPLNRIGDTEGAKLTPSGVVMPEGFAAAYRAYVDGGWGALACPAEHGGQGLPFVLGMALLEDL